MTEPFKNQIVIFCDGACSGNPGSGGWGAIIATPEGHVRELGAHAELTTNNQMEMSAVLESLRAIADRHADVSIYTDSVYVIQGITRWIWGWRKRNWQTADGTDVANRELWQRLAAVVAERKKLGKLAWHFVRGHSGVPGNERCDEIAVEFSKRKRVKLYDGPLLRYDVAIYDIPENTDVPTMKPKQEKKPAAYSYLSLVNGELRRHKTWAECEQRVKGRSGAKFKKTKDQAEEDNVIRGWGHDPKSDLD